MVTVKTC